MEVSMDPKAFAQELGVAGDAPIGPAVGVASIALNMAMKYHDMGMVTDGALYQQYKLEGRNITTISLADVFDTAIQIEKHLIRSNQRIADSLIAVLLEAEAAEQEADAPNDTDETTK